MPTLRDTVKSWFVTRAKPTQAQFWSLFDSLFFKDEGIDINSVAGLNAQLASKADSATVTTLNSLIMPDVQVKNAAFTIVVPAHTEFEKIRFKPTVGFNLSIGLTNGGSEVWPGDTFYEANQWHIIELTRFDDVQITYYLSGLAAATTFYIYKR